MATGSGLLHARSRVCSDPHTRDLLLPGAKALAGGWKVCRAVGGHFPCHRSDRLAGRDFPAIVPESLCGDGLSGVDARISLGQCGFIESWARRFLTSPIEWMLILVERRNDLRRHPTPDLIPWPLRGDHAGGDLRVVTVTPRYSLAFMPVLDLLAGLALVPLLGTFAEASQLCRRSAGCCGTLWQRLVSGRPPSPQSKSPFGGGCDIYTPKRIGEQGSTGTAKRYSDTALLFSWNAAARIFRAMSRLRRTGGFRPDAAIAAARP